MPDVLGQRALNRALLARQLLLERSSIGSLEAVRHLVGLQAQAPNAPYVALWSRLSAFQPGDVGSAIEARALVRAPLWRGTIHLVDARDFLAARGLLQPLYERTFSTNFARNVQGVDVADVVAAGKAVLDGRPRTRADLARLLARRWPDGEPLSLAYAITHLLPVVQVPPRGIWGATGQATWAAAETWLRAPLEAAPTPDEHVLRYLAAFGPATAADVRAWSGLAGVGAVMERLRPRLRTFRDERSRELFDVPDAPLPDSETAVPPRFLPEYDNALLSHADRTRIVADGGKPPLPPGRGGARGTFLIDGFMRGTWRVEGGAIRIEPFSPLSRRESQDLEMEAEALRAFVSTLGR